VRRSFSEDVGYGGQSRMRDRGVLERAKKDLAEKNKREKSG